MSSIIVFDFLLLLCCNPSHKKMRCILFSDSLCEGKNIGYVLTGSFCTFKTTIKEMEKLPGVIFLIDPKKERIAILEAKKLGIPVVGLVDTNCNPEELDYPIPGNDDAIRAVKLIADVMANAVIEGKQGESFEPEMEQEQVAETEEPMSIEEVVEVAEKTETAEEATEEQEA